jgi:hypothetical protein
MGGRLRRRQRSRAIATAGIDLDEFEFVVALVVFELHLCDSRIGELPQQSQTVFDDHVDPQRLADPARADAVRRLAKLATAEDA